LKNMTNISTLDDLKKSYFPGSGEFNKIVEDAKRGAVADQNEVDLQLTEEMLPELIYSLHMDKPNREQYLEQSLEKKKKRVALRIVGPKKQFDSENTNKKQEKEEDYSWYVIEFNVYSLTQLQIYINIDQLHADAGDDLITNILLELEP
jgi:hypothetical protein